MTEHVGLQLFRLRKLIQSREPVAQRRIRVVADVISELMQEDLEFQLGVALAWAEHLAKRQQEENA